MDYSIKTDHTHFRTLKLSYLDEEAQVITYLEESTVPEYDWIGDETRKKNLALKKAKMTTISAQLFTASTLIVMLFQACLAAGAPWGAASMGGKYPGKYPPKMRVLAVVNMLILGFMAALVLSKAQLIFPQLETLSKTGIWFVVAFSFIASIMNTITPSKSERIWAPVALIQFITSLIIALN